MTNHESLEAILAVLRAGGSPDKEAYSGRLADILASGFDGEDYELKLKVIGNLVSNCEANCEVLTNSGKIKEILALDSDLPVKVAYNYAISSELSQADLAKNIEGLCKAGQCDTEQLVAILECLYDGGYLPLETRLELTKHGLFEPLLFNEEELESSQLSIEQLKLVYDATCDNETELSLDCLGILSSNKIFSSTDLLNLIEPDYSLRSLVVLANATCEAEQVPAAVQKFPKAAENALRLLPKYTDFIQSILLSVLRNFSRDAAVAKEIAVAVPEIIENGQDIPPILLQTLGNLAKHVYSPEIIAFLASYEPDEETMAIAVVTEAAAIESVKFATAIEPSTKSDILKLAASLSHLLLKVPVTEQTQQLWACGLTSLVTASMIEPNDVSKLKSATGLPPPLADLIKLIKFT